MIWNYCDWNGQKSKSTDEVDDKGFCQILNFVCSIDLPSHHGNNDALYDSITVMVSHAVSL